MNTSVLRAVFTRNFTSYFSNATGYVFICVFVLLSSFAAFWPNDFFNNNLANLDELNKWFPFIMLIFIPAITMSAWAEERREGTDELLLTMPGNDLDIVLGKYLAAVVIYTVSLLFSMLTNYCVLQYLGNPDVGLFVATYLGYWFVGLAMLAVGMVASFLTSNLTVGYVLGAVLNAPLVFATQAGNVLGSQPAIVLRQWSIGQQMADFGHGVVSLTAVVYFVAIVVITLYLCMVLIGRRHWT
ncbi:MAG: ABC-2 transporter permease, partial [Pirellulales bacterium]|nr:ABC-2 transporter permease [Pirellulales bacterium]